MPSTKEGGGCPEERQMARRVLNSVEEAGWLGERRAARTRRALNSQEGAKWPGGAEYPGLHRKKKDTQVTRRASSSQESAE